MARISELFDGLVRRHPLQLSYYRDRALSDALRRVVEEEEVDLLYSQLIRMAQYTEPYQGHARVAAFNLSMTLNHRRLAEHASSLAARAFHWLEHRKMRSFEADFARRFDRVLYISKHDLEAAAAEGSLDNVFLVPHGVDYRYFAPDDGVEKLPQSIVVTGNMSYAPNIDAVRYLCAEILPLVRREIPEVTLSVVGADPPPALRALADDGAIEVTGRVPDLRVFMNRAEVAVAPIRIGAGLQNKVLEGMSMALPMVITSVANEGIGAVDGENILVADSPEELASNIVELLRSAELRGHLGTAAREFIVREWSWEKHFADLEDMMEKLVANKRERNRSGAAAERATTPVVTAAPGR